MQENLCTYWPPVKTFTSYSENHCLIDSVR
jgi:hypothetical protein